MARDVVTWGAGTWLQMGDHLVRVLGFSRDGQGALLVSAQTDGGSALRMPYAEFCRTASQAAERFIDDALVVPTGADWEALPDAVKDRAVVRARDLLQISTGSPTGRVERDRVAGLLDTRYDPAVTTLRQRVESKAAELKGRQDRPWSRPQIWRQLAAFEEDGLLGLVHQRRLHSEPRDLPSQLTIALDTALANRADQAQVGARSLAAIMRSELTDQGFDLTSVSGKQWERIVAEATRGRALHRGAVSRKTHNNKPQTVYGRRTVSRPGELVQIDATTTTIHCFFPDVGWGRATILTAIDVYSRCILALRVAAGSPNSRDVGMLLWDIGRPTVTRAGAPYELRLWHGVPELAIVVDDPGPQPPRLIGAKPAVTPSMIVLDHGRENESVHLQSAAAQAGISIVYAPPATPHAKGIVESWHNTVDTIQSLLPGYKGASPGNHPAGIEDAAVLTVGDLHDALWEYVLTIYHHRHQAGLRDPHNPILKPAPAEVFERYLEHGGQIAIPTDPWRMLAFLSRARCSVQDYGLNLHNRIYNSSDLLALREHLQRGIGAPTERLTVYYDRYDISRVYARHPMSGQWMMIPRWDPEALASAPYGEVLTDVARRSLMIQGHSRPNHTDLQIAEARFHAAWNAGLFADRREQRLAAIERAHAQAYAHDLADATDEVRSLAFPPAPPATEPNVYAPVDLPFQPEDDDVLTYTDIDLDGYLP